MQSTLRRSQWSETRIHTEHGLSPVTYIYRVNEGDKEHPWLVVAQSAVLAQLGIDGWGLYAAKSFKKGDYLGKMDGALVGQFSTREEAMSAPATRRLLRQGRDKLVTVRSPQGSGFHLLDCQGAGPPHLEMANDPRGTRRGPSAELTEYGWMRVTRARIPAFSLCKPIQENGDAEILWCYGDEYWDLFETLGQRANPIEVE